MTATSKIFTYSGTLEPSLRARSGQPVTIVRPLTEREADLDEVGRMYRVVFPDGIQVDAFEDELTDPQEVSNAQARN